jgi:hypothetical protein
LLRLGPAPGRATPLHSAALAACLRNGPLRRRGQRQRAWPPPTALQSHLASGHTLQPNLCSGFRSCPRSGFLPGPCSGFRRGPSDSRCGRSLLASAQRGAAESPCRGRRPSGRHQRWVPERSAAPSAGAPVAASARPRTAHALRHGPLGLPPCRQPPAGRTKRCAAAALPPASRRRRRRRQHRRFGLEGRHGGSVGRGRREHGPSRATACRAYRALAPTAAARPRRRRSRRHRLGSLSSPWAWRWR